MFKIIKKANGFWWLALVIGIVFVVLGTIAIFNPDFILAVIFVFVGVALIVSGVNDILTYRILKNSGREGFCFYALINIFLGMLLIGNPIYSVIAVVYYFGIWALLRGVIQIMLARRFNLFGNLTAHFGFVLMVIGLFILLFPRVISGTFMFLFGIFAIIFGVNQIGDAMKIRKALKPSIIIEKSKKYKEK